MAVIKREYRVLRSDDVSHLESVINNQYLADPDTYPDVQFHGGMGIEYASNGLGVYRYHQTISFIKSNK